jgi:hypothetical protein
MTTGCPHILHAPRTTLWCWGPNENINLARPGFWK